MTTRRAFRIRLRRGYRPVGRFLRAIRGADYLAAKAVDFGSFTLMALLVTAVFVACTVFWDYAIDPVNAWRAIWLRMAACGGILLWMLATSRGVHSPVSRLAAVVVPLWIEGTFIQVLSILDSGPSYGMGGFLYYFIFLPFVLMAQPFFFSVLVLAAITVFPMVAAPFGLSANLDWGIYNAYVWMGFVPIVCILLLFEYLYWNVYKYRSQVEAQAVTDGLTRTANRRYFLAEGTRSLQLSHRNRRSVSLLFIDIDHFKTINDNHGHRMGDAVINHVVQTLRPLLRASDMMARYGGEEFVVLLPETKPRSARRIAERMRMAVMDNPFGLDADDASYIDLAVSIGVATRTPHGEDAPDIDVLIHNADLALYEAKRRGRNRVVSHAPRHAAMAVEARHHGHG